jgi:hypothetical protein
LSLASIGQTARVMRGDDHEHSQTTWHMNRSKSDKLRTLSQQNIFRVDLGRRFKKIRAQHNYEMNERSCPQRDNPDAPSLVDGQWLGSYA